MGVRSLRALMKKSDQSTGEMLFVVGCRDDRPIVDSGRAVSTCPVDYATSVPTEKSTIQYEFGVCSVNLFNITASSVMFFSPTELAAPRTSILRSLTQKRAILSVHKGCGNDSMIVFTPDGKGKIVSDTKSIDQVKQIMASTPGFDIVYDRGAYALDVDVNDRVYVNDERRKFESDSGISLPMIRKDLEKALSQAQHDRERKESI